MKNSYDMDRVMTGLKEMTETVVSMSVLCFNLKKLERLLYALIQWVVNELQSFVLILE